MSTNVDRPSYITVFKFLESEIDKTRPGRTQILTYDKEGSARFVLYIILK